MTHETNRDVHDAIVLGGGAIGLLTAYRLQGAGVQTLLLAPEEHPGRASTAAGAMLGTFGEVVASTFATEAGRARFELDLRAGRRWTEQFEEIGDELRAPSDSWTVADETTVIHNTAGSTDVDDRAFDVMLHALREHGADWSETDPGSIGLRPRQSHRPLRAVTIGGERAIDPGHWLSSVRDAFLARGGQVLPRRAASLVSAADSVTGVVDDHDEVHSAAWVVSCLGAFTTALLRDTPGLETVMPVFSGAGVAADLSSTPAGLPPRTVIRTPNRAFACGLHAVPRSSGGMYVGATNHIVPKPTEAPLVDDALFLLTCAVEQLHGGFAAARIARLHAGNRPVSADGVPLIGRAPVDGLVIVSGTYREGIHLSPVIADHVLSIVRDEQDDPLWDQFRPDRAPVSRGRDEVIEATVAHAVAVGDEYGWVMPVGARDDLAANYRAHFIRVLDWLDVEAVPPPEVLVELHRAPGLVSALRSYDKRRTRAAVG